MRFSKIPVVILIALLGALTVFQNCTPAVPYGNTDYYQALVNSPVFPYEAGVDQLAYLSCSEQDDVANDGTFFTFRAGAFDSMGLRISQSFRDQVQKVSDENTVFALQENRGSAGARIQMAIRTLDNLQLMYVDSENGEDGLDGYDYNNFFPALGNEFLSEILWHMEPGDYLRTFPSAQHIDEYRFEGNIQFMRSQQMENDLRTFLSNRGIITVTFASLGEIKPLGPASFQDLQAISSNPNDGGTPGSDVDGSSANGSGKSGSSGLSGNGSSSGGGVSNGGSSNGGNSIPPSSNGGGGQASVASYVDKSSLATDVFGMAIQPRFKQPLTPFGGSPGSDMPPRVLSSVSEIRIDGRVQTNSIRPWICPDSMQFMIVLPEHATYVNDMGVTVTRCEIRPDPINPSADLKKVRQSLYAEDWYVDMTRGCVVPKEDHVQKGSCYGLNSNTQDTHIINYDTYSVDGCGFGNAKGLCPHYASVCYRQ